MPMNTAQDLIDSALRLAGLVDRDSTPSTSLRQNGLDALNGIIDSLVLNQLAVYRYDDEQVTVSATETNWGPGSGGITSTRPVQLIAGRLVSGTSELPVRVMDIAEYRALPDKTAGFGMITAVSYDPAMPYGKLYVFGSTSGTLKITSLKPWTQYAALSSPLDLPPGYVRYLRHSLAVEIGAENERLPNMVSVAIVRAMERQMSVLNARPVKISNDWIT